MGWFRVDLEATPEYAVFDPEKPNQVIVGPFMSRPLNMKKMEDQSKEQTVELLANVVRELSGDWIVHVQCDQI